MIYLIVFYLLFCCLVVKLAEGRGRSGLLFLVLALFVSPLVAGFILFLVPKNEESIERNRLRSGFKKCVHCGELIRREASVCRFCHRAPTIELAPQGTPSAESDGEFYILGADNATEGPYSLNQLRNLWRLGRISKETLYAEAGYTDWLPLEMLNELFPSHV